MSNSDINRLAASLKKNRDNLKEVVEYSYPMILNFFKARISQSEVYDQTQETFRKMLVNIDLYNPEKGMFTTWLYTIAANTLKDYIKKHKKTYTLDTVEAFAVMDFEAAGIDDRITMDRIRASFAQLPNSMQKIFEMRYIFHFKNKEIADFLKIKESTVSAELAKGVEKLEAILKSDGQTV